MKPIYQSRKFWTAILTAVSMIVAHRYSPELAKLIAGVGAVLVAGFGLEDHGKAAAVLGTGDAEEPTSGPGA